VTEKRKKRLAKRKGEEQNKTKNVGKNVEVWLTIKKGLHPESRDELTMKKRKLG